MARSELVVGGGGEGRGEGEEGGGGEGSEEGLVLTGFDINAMLSTRDIGEVKGQLRSLHDLVSYTF